MDDVDFCEASIPHSIMYNNVSSGLSVHKLPSASFSYSLGIIIAVRILFPRHMYSSEEKKPVLDIQKRAVLLC